MDFTFLNGTVKYNMSTKRKNGTKFQIQKL